MGAVVRVALQPAAQSQVAHALLCQSHNPQETPWQGTEALQDQEKLKGSFPVSDTLGL